MNAFLYGMLDSCLSDNVRLALLLFRPGEPSSKGIPFSNEMEEEEGNPYHPDPLLIALYL